MGVARLISAPVYLPAINRRAARTGCSPCRRCDPF
jgi:hypothetical protein